MKKVFKIILFLILLIGSLVAYLGYKYYGKVFAKNVKLNEDYVYLYIARNSSFEQVMDSLRLNNFIKNPDDFIWVANLKKYPQRVKGGKYKIYNGMTNNSLVNLLRSGNQETVNVTFNNIRTKEDFAFRISKQVEASYEEILGLLKNEKFLEEYGFNSDNVLTMFLPNTYQFYWATGAKTFFDRMYSEYHKFWNDKRLKQASEIKLTPIEVSILASIVQSEQSKYNDEKPIIAGLYLNRLRKGMALQSDPTLVFAMGDFTITRVLNEYKEIESPYNTYKYAGLPPGPITMAEISSIDAVLNYQKNDYIFMCAKDDFSGYHYFSKTASQHYVYAKRYHAALNKQKIFK